MMRSKVDLPQPLGPTSVMNSPSSIASDTLSSTPTDPNFLRIFCITTLAILVDLCGTCLLFAKLHTIRSYYYNQMTKIE